MSVGCSRRGQPAMRWGTWRGAASTGHWVGFRFPLRESSFPVPLILCYRWLHEFILRHL